MRIAIVGPSAPLRGGIAQHTDRLVTALARDHEVDLYPLARQYPAWLFPGKSQRDPGTDPPQDARLPFDPYRRGSWTGVARDIVARSPDLVLVQWWHPWFALSTRGLLVRLRRGFGTADRLTVVCHNVLPHRPVPLQKTLTRAALRQAGQFVVHADSEAMRLRTLLGGAPIVHRALLPSLAPTASLPDRTTARAALGIGNAPLVLFFGLVRTYKGLDDLLVALARMRRRDARLLVAGEFYDSRARHERAARELGIADRVEFRDHFVPTADVPALFAAADVVALPYRSATQSSVLPLAVHYHKRFVVTNVGGLVEATQGLTEAVPARDPSALAAALDAAIEAGPVEDQALDLARWQRAAEAFRPEGIRETYARVAASLVPASTAGGRAPDRRSAVTVIVAAHGACPDVEATIAALAKQESAADIEVLVIYDGDVDQLRQRLSPHPPSFLRVVGESALGLNIKRNRGIAEARGDLLLFTDDDCVPDPRWVATMTAALATRPIVTGAVAALGQGVRASLRERSQPRPFHGWFDTLLPWRAGCGNNLGMRRDIARRLGAFEPRIGVGTWSGAACDTEFLFRALRAPGIGVFYEPAAIVRHRQEALGRAVLDKRRRYYRGISFMARRIHPDFPTVWMTAMLRLVGTAVLCLWSRLRFDRDGWLLHHAELRGAWEGFFPPAVPGPAVVGSLGSKQVMS